jgi:hypothetical protein
MSAVVKNDVAGAVASAVRLDLGLQLVGDPIR